LQKMAEGAADMGVQVDTRVTFGRAYKEILRIAAEERADLVVMGAQGHGVIEHMLSGSNAQHVIRGATCPVLTVRPLRVGRRPETKTVGLTLAATAASQK
ncbi:MAG TPA: universal stress protein, partial [Vicinamibacteria bacterium]|nr:universal stress protein [Vicinamibacteria bacterium]